MPTWTLPLPPSTNHGYTISRRGIMGSARLKKTDVLDAWEEEVALHLAGWEPPKHTPLAVTIDVYLDAPSLRRRDIDGSVKFIVDNVVGKRRDQWVDTIHVSKRQCQGMPSFVRVNVEVMAETTAGLPSSPEMSMDEGRCECGAVLQIVRPGKYQCPKCG